MIKISSKVVMPNLPYLEHYPEPGSAPQRIFMERFPFRIGRNASAECVIYSRQVSKEHTEIVQVGTKFRIRDLDSANGTFVNGQRIQESALVSGDIIHIAHKELRFGHEPAEAPREGDVITDPSRGKMPSSRSSGRTHLREMLQDQCARVLFQPILNLESCQVVGYEALARGTHSELSTKPADLLRLAHQCNMAAELSSMFRQVAVKDVKALPNGAMIFFNLHPSEIDDDALIDSLRDLKVSLGADRPMFMEVHEEVAADVSTMHWLKKQLSHLGIGLAFDDFGAGKARLQDLAQVPPDIIKLDRALIHDIDSANARQDLVKALVGVTSNLGVKPIAEGIETQAELDVCRQLGFQLGQGYLLGIPQSVELLVKSVEPSLSIS